MEDSPWKAALVTKVLRDQGVTPTSICDVGCGAGFVLAELRKSYPDAELFGYDIAPAASRFWADHDSLDIHFQIGDFAKTDRRSYDVLLLLDVIEHVPDPIEFLISLRGHARMLVLHIPLDLSALSVIRERPLLEVRDRVGHIHYFTKTLALALLQECGLDVLRWDYSGASSSAPRRSWRAKAASVPRWLAYRLGRDLGVRTLGGETLVVLASQRQSTQRRQG